MLRRQRFIVLVVSVLALCSVGFSAAPQSVGAAPGNGEQLLIDQLARATSGTVRISRHSATGMVRFIGATADTAIAAAPQLAQGASPEQAARAFLGQYGALFGATDPANELRISDSHGVEGGRSAVRFQQVYQNVPVLGGELYVNLTAANKVLSANGELQPKLSLSVTPAFGAAAAQAKVRATLAKDLGRAPAELKVSAPELWIYNSALLGGPGLGRPTLVWRMDVTAGALEPLRELVLVDAQTGIVALHFNQLGYAKERSVCDKLGVVDPDDVCTDATAVRSEGDGPTGITDVDLAYDYAGITYDFYNTLFGRDSLDGAGLHLRSTVRYCPDAGNCPYENAYWNGQQMVYGTDFASADDVVGHELTHGVTDFTSHLFYYYQAGAINESLSDVFGELIDQRYDSASDDDSAGVKWALGEDLPASIGIIRNMADPTIYGDPDRMGSANYTADLNERDSGGVHSNSGVNNKTAFLMTDGATFNGRTVTGLGADKVARIYYEAATNLLLSASDYADLYDYLQQACAALVGSHGITAANCAEVRDAVDATEMNGLPTTAPNPEAPICGAGQLAGSFFFDDLEDPGSGTWASSALSGSNTWFYPQLPNAIDFDATYATSGKYNIWGYDNSTKSDYVLGLTSGVALPANAWLHFRHSYGFEDGLANYDGGILEYSINNGASWVDAGSLITNNGYNGTISNTFDNPLKGRSAFVGESNGYISSRLNLSSLAGKSVRIRFRIGADSGGDDYGWFIDDIRMYTCGAAPTGSHNVFLPQTAR